MCSVRALSVWILVCVAACTSSELQVVFEQDHSIDWDTYEPRPVGMGLVSDVAVHYIVWQPSADDPDDTIYERDQLTWTVDGGESVDCGGVCVRATSDRISIDVDTPNGHASATRDVVRDIRLATYTPGWGHVTNDAVHVEVGSTVNLQPVFRASSGGVVSGHADYATTGPITLTDWKVTANAAGDGTVFAPSLPDAPPLVIRGVTRDQSAASIASFAIDRMFYDSALTKLTLYTESPAYINSFVIEAFDADGALALRGLTLNATGANLSPRGLTDGPCTTEDYCFLHPQLPDGVDALDTELEVSAGSASQRIPVHIIRAAY